MMKLQIKYILGLLSSAVLCLCSCNDFVEVPQSKSEVESRVVFGDSALATSALLGAYFTLENSVAPGLKHLSLYVDEYAYLSTESGILEFNTSQLSANNYINSPLWNGLFAVIYQANMIVEETGKSSSLSFTAKNALQGEALFLRAYCYFYLVNLYGHIPLVLTADVNLNKSARQVEPQLIYGQLIKDLTEAKSKLPANDIGAGRVRANSLAASALLARVYLFNEQWNNAENEAGLVIASGKYNPLPKPEGVYLAESKEAIFQLWNANGMVGDVVDFTPGSAAAVPPYTLTESLAHAFEAEDQRKSKWVSIQKIAASEYPYPAKYKKSNTNPGDPEYRAVLRLAEQYLIRAEAIARQGSVPAAVADVNIIRNRAGLLPLSTSLSKQDCLDAILRERRLELFGEWGHRFLDLKRFGILDAVMMAVKPEWKPEAKVLPIPFTEILYNSNLFQNDGY
jgi:hypothetical protein